MNPVTYIIINGAIAVLIWTGGIQVNSGIITQGEVVALVNYMSQILIELVKLANLIITVTKAVACGNRIESILEIRSGMKEGTCENQTQHSEYAVVFDQVTMQYQDGGEPAVTDISFKVRPGETIGVIGGTGSGKSTIVNLIPRFYDVAKGAVLVDGINVKDYRFQELRDKIGIVPQKAVLFTGTIRDNIKWGKKDATDEEINEALEVAQAKIIVEEKADGLDAMIEQGGHNLSGGQKQRLTIARALVKKPKILILDDSASALDYATDANLRHAIRNRKTKPAVFLVSQRAASILHADQILVLDDGNVAGLGTHEALLKSCEVYQEIYYSQFQKKTESVVNA